MSLKQDFTRGILAENPTFRLILGMCPTLAVSTSLVNAIGMGAATTFVLLGSNILVSLFRKFIPSNIRIPAFIVIIATFVTIVELIMQAYFPALNKSLGIFIPLIVVNCIILGRAEAFASKNPVFPSIMDALGMGIGFTGALALLGATREILGAGTIWGYHILGTGFNPVIIMILPPGAFIALGLFLGLFNSLAKKRKA
ncbi:MAG: electron transport complex subunit E [bacterium]|nr:electron transport complex subunit E [bacterium]